MSSVVVGSWKAAALIVMGGTFVIPVVGSDFESDASRGFLAIHFLAFLRYVFAFVFAVLVSSSSCFSLSALSKRNSV